MKVTGFAKWYEVLDRLYQHGLPERVLLTGPPGTGKTTWPTKRWDRVYQVAVTEDTAADELIGTWAIKGGETVFLPGPAVLAFGRFLEYHAKGGSV